MLACQWDSVSFLLTKKKEASGTSLHGRTGRACGKFDLVFRERIEMDQQQPVPGQVQIKADEKELQGQYSNLVMIHHNLEEFTMNFIYIFPNGAQGKLLASMIVSPGHAKRIWRALGENLARYEAQFGEIVVPTGLAEQLFKPPRPDQPPTA